MPFSEIFALAFQNIRANLLRAVLTLLIIAFGIMALVGILTAIDAIAFSLTDNLAGLGANTFTIQRKWEEVQSNRHGRRDKVGDAISFDECLEFKERFDFPATVTVTFTGTSLATAKHQEVKSNPNILVTGIDENFLDIKKLDLEKGRNFTKLEVEDGQPKAILGREMVKILFDNQPEKALDQIISVNNIRYRVVGVLKSKGSSMNTSEDRTVYTPLIHVKTLYGTDNTDYEMIVSVKDALNMDAAQSEATGLFRVIRRLRPGLDNDFEMVTSNSLVSLLKDNTTNLRLGTIAIGLMTLLGAAIGLMNIMLVSVTERTREIGIYKALGATRRSILIQFLTEAVLICLMGGALGIVLGILMGNIVTPLLGGSFLIPWGWIALGLTLCIMVGVVSGFYPAMKAAQLDPIEALRYE